MIFPCPSRTDCGGTDLPFANLTSEAPDREVFIGQGFGYAWIRPPIGSNWARRHCLGVCTSLISQADADLCAAIQNLLCLIDTWGVCPSCDGDGNGFSGPPLIPRLSLPGTLFYNGIQHCTVNCIDGRPFTYQVAAGLFAGTTQGLADRFAFEYACKLAIERLICLSSGLAVGCADDFYSSEIIATAPAPVRFTITAGSLPPGITATPIGTFTLALTGIPTTAGAYSFTVKATDNLGDFMQKTYALNVFGITNGPLPAATDGAAYSEQLTTAGGTGTVTFTLDSGALPSGLTLSDSGLISGIPSSSGDFNFTVRIEDSTEATCTKELSLHVNPGTGPGAWYPFEDAAPPPFIDSENAIPLVVVAGSAGVVAQGAGKVGAKSLSIQAVPGVTMTQNPSNAALNVNGGFTITGWFGHAIWAMQAGSFVQTIFRNYNGIWSDPGNPGEPVVLEVVFTRSSTQYEIRLRDGLGINLVTPITIPAAFAVNTYYFFTIRYDQAGTGRLYFSVNGGAETASIDAYGVAIPNVAGRLMVAAFYGGLGISLMGLWDELNYWDHSLSAAEMAAIYNGGAGRTWP